MSQFWPTKDEFLLNAVSAGVTWKYPDRYIQVNPFTNVLSIPMSGSTLTMNDTVGLLCGNGDTFDNQPNAAPLGASMTAYDGETRLPTTSLISATVAERQTYESNVEVLGEFSLDITNGNPAQDEALLRGYFVWARLSGGAVVAGGGVDPANPVETINKPAGIFFGHVKLAGKPDQFIVGYTGDGFANLVIEDTKLVQTLFGGFSQIGSSINSYTDQPYKFYQPGHLRMVCNGSNVTCYAKVGGVRRNVGSTGGATLAEVEVFNITSSSWPTAAGRCGVSPQLPLANATHSAIMRCTRFRIRDAAATEILFNDQFDRFIQHAAHLPPPMSAYPTEVPNGFSLMSAYTGDAFGPGLDSGTHTGNTGHHFMHLLGNKSTDRVDMGVNLDTSTTGSDQEYGWYYSQNKAIDQLNQRVIAEFDDNSSAQGYEAGVCLRMDHRTTTGSNTGVHQLRAADQQGPTSNEFHDDKSGYLATLLYDTVGGTKTVYIYKYEQSVTRRTIGSVDIGVGTTTNPFTLEFEMRQVAGQAMSEMRVSLDGVPLNLTLQGTAEPAGNGWITDTAGDFAGGGRGFFFRASDSTELAALISVKSIEYLAPSDDDSTPGSEDQASVVLGGEDANKAGELTIPLSWDIDTEVCYVSRDGDLNTGKRFSSPKYTKMRRAWSVNVKGASYDEMDSLIATLTDSKTGMLPFDWTRADTGETFTAIFDKASLSVKNDHSSGGNGAVSARFGLTEVIGQETFN